jgi:hypothetical protein
MFDMPFL